LNYFCENYVHFNLDPQLGIMGESGYKKYTTLLMKHFIGCYIKKHKYFAKINMLAISFQEY